MGIVTFAAPVAGVRGKVGGVVYSANKSGAYLKNWGRGSNPRTQIQTTHRNDLAQFAQAWAAITAAQRTAWDVYAALAAQDKTNSLGETYSVSGFSWFVTLNIARRQNGQAQLSAAPVLATPAASVITNVRAFETASAGTTNILLPAGSPNINATNAIHARLVNSIGHTVQAEVKPFVIAKNFGVTTVNLAIKTELLEMFGTAQVGQNLFIKIAIQNSEGRRGPIAAASDYMRA
jgi:hypothetical protein